MGAVAPKANKQYVIQVCRQLSSRIRTEHPDPARKLFTNLYDVYHCRVYNE
jgi:hypothetical protein